MCMTEVVDEDSDPKDLSPADFTLAPTATIYEKSNFGKHDVVVLLYRLYFI